MTSAPNDRIHRFAAAIGVDETILRRFMQSKITETNINEFGRFDILKVTVDQGRAKVFLETMEGKPIKKFQINMKVDQTLIRFILEGGFDITYPIIIFLFEFQRMIAGSGRRTFYGALESKAEYYSVELSQKIHRGTERVLWEPVAPAIECWRRGDESFDQ